MTKKLRYWLWLMRCRFECWADGLKMEDAGGGVKYVMVPNLLSHPSAGISDNPSDAVACATFNVIAEHNSKSLETLIVTKSE